MRERSLWFLAGALLTTAAFWLLYQLPPVKFQLEWRLDAFSGIVRGWLHPGDTLPAPKQAAVNLHIPPTSGPRVNEAPTTPRAPETPAATPTPLPEVVRLSPPEWEKQDWNNCGPATLALALRYYGWEGDQFTISDLLKPDRGDKNVNVEELVYYVRTRAGWLQADYRVGGTRERLQALLAAGFPVVVEKGFILAENDGGGGWAGHYLLLTGYDQARDVFLAQDTNPIGGGADREISYAELDEGWRAFNRVYLLIHRPEAQETITRILDQDADVDANRERTLEQARTELAADPEDAYAWFNLGSNLVYFERYGEAAQAFDNALGVGLPWRFTRYQFGPYIAYFHQARFQDLVDLADATLYRTYKAEESLLWRGWGRYRLGDSFGAIEDFREALEYNPNYLDAQYALEFVGATR
jgi:tetratricopeptide (TPR) repeat protein